MLKVSVEELERLYEDGKSLEALGRIAASYPTLDAMPVEAMEIMGYCHFRREEYDQATEIALKAIERGSVKAEELLAQLAGYVSKDDELLTKIHFKLPKNPGVCTAIAIRARDNDSTIPKGIVIKTALRFMGDDLAGHDCIAATNLINNTARLLLAKGNRSSDTVMAIGFWQIALLKYGDANYHHRAAVHFWLSKAYENLKEKKLAIKCAEDSLALWEKQVDLDPTNPGFKKKLEGARARLAELKN